MSDFKAKMHKIAWGACSQRSPDPKLNFRGPTSKGGEGGRGEDPLLSRYTPIHYILDKGLRQRITFRTACIQVSQMPGAASRRIIQCGTQSPATGPAVIISSFQGQERTSYEDRIVRSLRQ